MANRSVAKVILSIRTFSTWGGSSGGMSGDYSFFFPENRLLVEKIIPGRFGISLSEEREPAVEYRISSADADRFLDILDSVIDYGGIKPGELVFDSYTSNTMTVYDGDGSEISRFEWYTMDEANDSSRVRREFYEVLHTILKQFS